VAKAARWTSSDAEARKPGEQTGLDTHCVPHPGNRMVRIRLYRGNSHARETIPTEVVTQDNLGIDPLETIRRTSQGDDEIVRAARRRAEPGRNDLAPGQRLE
jgi:hypothetical protein